LVIALAGELQRSHLHVGNEVNVVVHTDAERRIEAAAAYSVAPTKRNVRIVIGDDLTFQFDVRWYDGETLPRKINGNGGGLLLPLLFGLIVGFGVCYVWIRGFKGVELGRVFKGRGGELPKYNGYAYGVGQPHPASMGYGVGVGKNK